MTTDETTTKCDKRGESIDIELTITSGTPGDIELKSGHCDECFEKIDYETPEFTPTDPTHTHHACSSCGLIDEFPFVQKEDRAVPEEVIHRRYRGWWGQNRKHIPTL